MILGIKNIDSSFLPKLNSSYLIPICKLIKPPIIDIGINITNIVHKLLLIISLKPKKHPNQTNKVIELY